MVDWIYVGAILFGAFSLLIEADRNYRTSLDNHPFPYHAILEKVELENLCTPREWLLGFLFYSLLYLLAYALILSSTELFLLVRSANLAELQVGANTDYVGPLSDPLELGDSTYGKPIFVSAFLIAFLSMGAMKPVETYMRALAHRLAGVPRGVYKVLEALQSVEYLKLNRGAPSPLVNKFDNLLNEKRSELSGLTDQYTEGIRAQLSTIDCLSPSVIAGFSHLHFPMTHFDAFKEVPDLLRKEIDDVEADIADLNPTEASLKSLHEKAVLTANSAKAVFAVFYVRNNHAIKNTTPNSPIARIEKLIARGYRIELNSFAMSICVSFILSLMICFFAYQSWNEAKVSQRPALAEAEIATVFLRLTEIKDLEARTAAQNTCVGALADPALLTEVDQTCAEAVAKGQAAWLRAQFTRFGSWSFWDTLQRGLMVFGVVVSTIFFREVRVDQNSWKPWSIKRIPFLRLLSMSAAPAAIGVFALSSGYVIQLVWDSGFDLTQRQLTILFQNYWIYFAWHFLPGMFLSIAALTLMDKHDDWVFEATALTGVLFAVVLMGLAWVIFQLTTPSPQSTVIELQTWFGDLRINHALRDTIIVSALPALFIFWFAVFLEATEESKQTRWLIGRPFASRRGKSGGFASRRDKTGGDGDA
ncbi:hypothetical protein [Ruegeria sp. HKCCD8929]|uniref:hypothetical protein n=1 Tax=Ruegeria sp. HKCCD8929 TaxID=2683006 RepID=UPI00148931C0|nr:hypothetical protein [Ruegeria sp. HKCCD8929]